MIKVDLNVAKQQAHEMRRAKRNEKFAPLDVQATIPHLADDAELARIEVRAADDKAQLDIDAVTGDVGDLNGPELQAIKDALASL